MRDFPRVLILFALLLIAFSANAQPELVWMSQYTTQSQTSYDMIQTSDGNYAHCVREENSGDILYLVSPDGDEIWHQTYGETGTYDANLEVVEMPDGGFIMAGYSWIDEQGAYDARLIRTDSDGVEIWTSFAGDATESDQGKALVRTDDGRIFMAGDGYSGTAWEAAIWEFNDDGDLINTWYFAPAGSSGYIGFTNILLTQDNNHLVMNGGGYYQTDNHDGYIVKCDLNGELVWQNVLSYNYWQHMTDVCEGADGSFFFVGNAALDDDSWPVYPWYGKVSATGITEFTAHYPGSIASSYLTVVRQDTDGDWLLGGRFEGNGEAHQDAMMLKIDNDDDSVIWELFEGDDTPDSDEGFSEIIVLSEGSYMLAGDGDFGDTEYPAFIAYYSDSGQYVEPGDQLKLPNEFRLANVYPNPFNAMSTISLHLPQPGVVRVSVYNTLGQEVVLLNDTTLLAGIHSFSWNASGMASGLYCVRATVSGHLDQVQKVMLVR